MENPVTKYLLTFFDVIRSHRKTFLLSLMYTFFNATHISLYICIFTPPFLHPNTKQLVRVLPIPPHLILSGTGAQSRRVGGAYFSPEELQEMLEEGDLGDFFLLAI